MNNEELECQKEFQNELTRTPDSMLEEMTAMVMAERQRRAGDISKWKDIEELEADRDAVKSILDRLVRTLEDRINDKTLKPVGFMDAFMAAINFCRVVIEDSESRQGFDTLEKKRMFRLVMLATLERSLMSRVMQ